jgi:cytochrome c biogenesis protein CcmG/thiol:disulfide interchange protein DsbE
MRPPTIAAICLAVVVACAAGSPAIAQTKQGAAPPAQGGKAPDKKSAATAKPRADYGKYEFKLTTLEGKTVKLSDYAGKVVLVNLWAPWCGPCKIEMPGFVKLHEKYRSQGFEIVSVAVQTTESAVRAFIEKTPIPWTVGINDDVAVKYGTYGLPDNYVFLPDGMLAKRFIGYTKEEALEPVIQAALKKIPK